MKQYMVRKMDRECEGMMWEIVASDSQFDPLAYVLYRPLAKQIVEMMNDPPAATESEVFELPRDTIAFVRASQTKEPKP